MLLAEKITGLYHSQKHALQAKQKFVTTIVYKEIPDGVKEIEVKPGEYDIRELLVICGLANSKSESYRLIKQGGVKIAKHGQDRKKITTLLSVTIAKQNSLLIQVGRRFIRIK